MNYTRHFECDCRIVVIGELTNAIINYCPKHEAAPSLYEALGRVKAAYTKNSILFSNMPSLLPNYIEQALAKAEG